MTTSIELFDLVVAALLGPDATATSPVHATGAGERVIRSFDLPTQEGGYPVIRTQILNEVRQALGRADVEFTTSTTIRIVAEVSEPAASDDLTRSTAETELWLLKRQIDVAVINSYPLFAKVQKLASVQTQLSFSAQSNHLAGIQSDFTFEFYEGPEDFAPIDADDLDDALPTGAHYPAHGFDRTLPQ